MKKHVVKSERLLTGSVRLRLAALSVLLNYLLWCIVDRRYFSFIFSVKYWDSKAELLVHLKDISMSLAVGVFVAFVTFATVDFTMRRILLAPGLVLPIIVAHLFQFFMNTVVALVTTLFVNKIIPWERTLHPDYGFLIYTITATVCTEIYFSLRFGEDIRQRDDMLQLLRIRQQKADEIIMSEQITKLRMQVDNHFMLNSLASLDILIKKDSNSAAEFSHALINCYRYLVLSAKRSLVQVNEELVFLKQYLEMLEYRFPGHFDVSFDIEDSSGYIPPLTIQELVSNAIKHNAHSDTIPLKITIKCDSSFLTVDNNICPLTSAVVSTGVGMDLMRSRYEALGTAIVVTRDEKSFSVMIPIIQSDNLYESSNN